MVSLGRVLGEFWKQSGSSIGTNISSDIVYKHMHMQSNTKQSRATQSIARQRKLKQSRAERSKAKER